MEVTMRKMGLLNDLIRKRFLWLLLFAYLLAALVPQFGNASKHFDVAKVTIGEFSWSLTLFPFLLAMLLFGAGLGTHLAELISVFRRPWIVFAGLAANVIVPLCFLYLIAHGASLWHNNDEIQNLLLGLAIVAAMPIAGSSTAWAHHSGGHMGLSIGLVLLSTLISPLVTPFFLWTIESMTTGEYSETLRQLSGVKTSMFIAAGVALPSFAGIVVRMGVGTERIAQVMPAVKLVNSAALLFLCYGNACSALPEIIRQPDWDFLLMMLLCVLGLSMTGFASGWFVAMLLNVNRAEGRSLVFGLGMNNNGTGLVLASSALHTMPWAILPILIYNLIQHMLAGLIVSLNLNVGSPRVRMK